MKIPVFLTYMFCMLSISILHARPESLIEVRSEVDTARITIGDRILYSIIIDRQDNLKIAKPGEGLNLGMFEIKDYNFHKPERRQGRIIERYDYTISVYDTGRFTIPPFPVAYFPDDTSNQARIIEAPSIEIFVESVLSGDEVPELKDIKGPLSIPFNYRLWISIAVIALLLLMLGWLMYRLWKKRRDKGYLFSPPPPALPAHEVALNNLEKLFAGTLLQEGQYKRFFIEISQIMRTYLEGRYYISALEETTSEIMRDVSEAVEEEPLRRMLNEILVLSDLVKFAKHIPEAQEIEQVKEQSVRFVNETKIIYELPAENEAADSAGSQALPASDGAGASAKPEQETEAEIK